TGCATWSFPPCPRVPGLGSRTRRSCRMRRLRSTRRARAITVPDVSTDLSPSDRARERDRERARARRGRTRRRALVWLVRVVAAAVLLFAGIAIGRALDTGGGSGAPKPYVLDRGGMT